MKRFFVKLWNYPTTRMALITSAMTIGFCLLFQMSFRFNILLMNVFPLTRIRFELIFSQAALISWVLAFISCVRPPYNKVKGLVCWPLMIVAIPFLLFAVMVDINWLFYWIMRFFT